MRPRGVVVLGVVVVAVSVSGAFASNGRSGVASDARSLGRAGAGVAQPGSALSMHINPALAPFVRDETLDVMPVLWDVDLEYADGQNARSHSAEAYLMSLNAAFVFDLRKTGPVAPSWDPNDDSGSRRARMMKGQSQEHRKPQPIARPTPGLPPLKFGLGLENSSNVHTQWNLTTNDGTASHWGSQYVVNTLTPTLAYQFDERWSVGLSLLVHQEKFELRQPLRNPTTPANDDAINVRDTDAFSAGFRLGGFWKVTDDFALGIAGSLPQLFRPDLDGKADFTLDPDGIRGNGDELTGTYDVRIRDMRLAPDLALGISWQALSRFHALTEWHDLTLCLDYRRIFWARTPDKVTIHFKNGTNPALPTSLNRDVPFNWDDQNVIALGAEVSQGRWLTLRSGVSYSTNPIPSDTLSPVFPFVTQWHAAVGFSIQVVNHLRVDFAYAHGFKGTERTADVSAVSSDLNAGEITAYQDIFALALTYDF